MPSLVSLEDVKTVLHIGTPEYPVDDDDDKIEILIEAASVAVLNYLKGDFETFMDDRAVKVATIALVGILYREPDGDESRNFSAGYLPRMVTALLYPLRDPALA